MVRWTGLGIHVKEFSSVQGAVFLGKTALERINSPYTNS